MSNIRALATVLLASTATACTIDPLPPRKVPDVVDTRTGTGTGTGTAGVPGTGTRTGAGVGTGGAPSTGTRADAGASCTDPANPVYCGAIGTFPGGCWASGTVCSTITNCGTTAAPAYTACVAAGYRPNCSGTACLSNSGGSGGTAGTGGASGGATGTRADAGVPCTDPANPVYCGATGTFAGGCWGSGTVCSTITNCGTSAAPDYKACVTAGYHPDCNGTNCLPSSGGGGGTAGAGGGADGGPVDSGPGLGTGADAAICTTSGAACSLFDCSATANTYSCSSSAIVRTKTDYIYAPSGTVIGWTNCLVEGNGNMIACTVHGDDTASSGYCIGSGGARCAWGGATVPTCDDPTTQTPSCGTGTGTGGADAGTRVDAHADGGNLSSPDAPVGTGDAGGGTFVGSSGPRCAGLAATCGPSGNESCCTSLLVPGGAFYRNYDGAQNVDKNYPATVADFYLDRYEITVGRFRAFVNAGMDTRAIPPADGTGAHPLIQGSGWDSAWNTPNLFPDTASLEAALNCDATHQTWTDTPAGNEDRPMNCLDWYDAFAFCAWDGGRLPTVTEWNYAAAGGGEQRVYPWSIPPTFMPINDDYAVYCGGSCSSTQNVGSKSPKGDGKWGHADLAGNVWEWTLDCLNEPVQCDNCASVTNCLSPSRAIRGGSYRDEAGLLESAVDNYVGYPSDRDVGQGARCARSAP